MKRVLLIEDLSCYGKCSMTVALPLLSVAGIEVIPLPTAVFSAHTGALKVPSIVDFSAKMGNFLENFRSLELRFDAILVGYSAGKEQLRVIDEFLEGLKDEKRSLVLVDPAMADHGRMYGKLPKDYPELMRNLAKKADILTPNLTEALILAERDFSSLPTTKEEVIELVNFLYGKYKKDLVITGVQTEEALLVVGISEGEMFETNARKMEKNYSGTGDSFAALFLAKLLSGVSFHEAMAEATRLTTLAVKNSIEEGMENLYFESILKEPV